MIGRLFPRQLDNSFAGQRAALWLLGIYVALKLAMSVNMMLNPAEVASGADAIPLEKFGPAAAQEVVTLFALVGLGQLALALIGVAVLVRYRAMVPLMFLLLLGEALARRAVVMSYAAERTEGGATALYINFGLIAVLALGLMLSLLPRRTPT